MYTQYKMTKIHYGFVKSANDEDYLLQVYVNDNLVNVFQFFTMTFNNTLVLDVTLPLDKTECLLSYYILKVIFYVYEQMDTVYTFPVWEAQRVIVRKEDVTKLKDIISSYTFDDDKSDVKNIILKSSTFTKGKEKGIEVVSNEEIFLSKAKLIPMIECLTIQDLKNCIAIKYKNIKYYNDFFYHIFLLIDCLKEVGTLLRVSKDNDDTIKLFLNNMSIKDINEYFKECYLLVVFL